MILVGYPQPVPAKGTCRILPLAKGDYPYVRGLVVKLNDAMRTAAAKRAKADFVDLLTASKGHDICAGPDAWVNGVNTDLMRALAFHPFAEEQQAVADLIMKKLDVSLDPRSSARPGRRRRSGRPTCRAAPRRSRPSRRRAASGSCVEEDQVAGRADADGGLAVDGGGQGLGGRERLLAVPGVAVVGAAVHGGRDGQPRVERRDRGVGAERELDAVVEHPAEREAALAPGPARPAR